MEIRQSIQETPTNPKVLLRGDPREYTGPHSVMERLSSECIRYKFRKPSNRPDTPFYSAIVSIETDWSKSLDSQLAYHLNPGTLAFQARKEFCDSVGLQCNDIISSVMMPAGYLRHYINRWRHVCYPSISNPSVTGGPRFHDARWLTQGRPWYFPISNELVERFDLEKDSPILIRYPGNFCVDVFPECLARELLKIL